MSEIGQLERKTQERVKKLFIDILDYKYLGDWTERTVNSNLEKELLEKYLKRQNYSQYLVKKAVDEIEILGKDNSRSIYDVNKDIYTFLRYGTQIEEEHGEHKKTVKYINWDKPEENDFYIAEEVSIEGEHKKRPDLVLYINGIALGVIELKRSTVSVNKGIRQNIANQQSQYIKPFFNTMQLIMAGNDTEGLRYGTIETKEKYYLRWKEDYKADDFTSKSIRLLMNDVNSSLDKEVIAMCHKKRILSIIHDFVVFDKGIKKICRPNQYFGVKAAVKRVKKREGGIIWHTQGSGKSLTMVWLAKWIRENIPDSRILIITDREELDKQIKKVFKGVDENIVRMKRSSELIEKLNSTTPLLMCSLIHKFGARSQKSEDDDITEYIEELEKNLPENFNAKGDIYLFIDECHRTQSGKLHVAMKHILPNSMFIGFTGTPLLKKDKKKSIEIFGSYIHTYKYDEAVEDDVVLDLRYEARDIDQYIESQEKIDQWFEAKTKGLTDYAKDRLKERWGTLQAVLSSKSRLEKIASDIIFDMETKDRLQNGKGNAMLISTSIYEACVLYNIFQDKGFKRCAVVTSYQPNHRDVLDEYTGEDRVGETRVKYETYNKMLEGKDTEKFEDEVKKKFVEQPANMKLLIVVDKLLTGFDAPPATYLYIDKQMQDHGLFQAICRVNRLHTKDKEYGYIIDYKDLFKSLEKSIDNYTSEAFEGYDKEDITDVIKNRLAKAKEKLDEALEQVKTLCEPVQPPKKTTDYIDYFVAEDTTDEKQLKDNEPKRIDLYKYVSSLVRSYSNIANEMIEAGYTPDEVRTIKEEVKKYDTVREEVMHAAGDYIDLKAYEGDMRHLIDTYIDSKGSKLIAKFEDLALVDLLVKDGKEAIDELPEGIKKDEEAVAETIENNVRKLIIEESPTNPAYYKRMSNILDEIILQRRSKTIEYKAYLDKIIELAKRSKSGGSSVEYPERINTRAQRALFDNLEEDEELASMLHQRIKEVKPHGWRGSKLKTRKIEYAVKEILENNEEKVDKIMEIIEEHRGEY
ncbi:type I restriction endonuclease subunit R [Halanaerobium sp.]|uniref:type I restriction endonuclease subunit R n=1 Tax=Halanaerobium sp. TaxID=1895664 RepID=UPI000DE7A996|nr:type I restriction endonuclease subunit R [Halanaerobium sp.]PUU90492.1 MAG: HsdR family type I site-specific deoxyribonuclease [Halanaerobium sp.]